MSKKKTIKPKEWTPNQIKRLPKEGYWLNIFDVGRGQTMYTLTCIKNGYIRYLRTDFLRMGTGWQTLMWTCMTTRNQMETLPEDRIGVYHHFNTIEEMQVAFPNLPEEFYQKPDNDF
jgi:hypothetical protein